MRTAINENVLTIVTDIPKSAVENGFAELVARNDKGDPQYVVKVSPDGKGDLSMYGLKANSIIDGKLAVVIVEEIGFEKEDFIKRYGKAAAVAAKYCPVIAEQAAAEEELIRSIFE